MVKLVNSYSKSHILQTFIISKTLFCKAFLGTLKPMHFSFVTLLMIFDEFDHLHLPQPRGRHGKVRQILWENPYFEQNLGDFKYFFFN